MTLGLVAMQLGELLPEAAPPLLAVCHPKRIKTVSGHMQAFTSHCTDMCLNADHKHTKLNEMFVRLRAPTPPTHETCTLSVERGTMDSWDAKSIN